MKSKGRNGAGHLPSAGMLKELSNLSIDISNLTHYRCFIVIDSKLEWVEIKVYVNDLVTSKIVIYKTLIDYRDLPKEFNGVRKRLEYFLAEGTRQN